MIKQSLANSFQEYNKLIMAELVELQKDNSRSAQQLVQILDDFELNYLIDISAYSQEIASLHLLSYLSIGDAINARWLWKRIRKLESGQTIQSHPLQQHILKTIKTFHSKKLGAEAFQQIIELEQFCQKQNYPHLFLIQRIKEQQKNYIYDVVSNNFSVISIQQLASYLNEKDMQKLIDEATKLHWSYDGVQFFKPGLQLIQNQEKMKKIAEVQINQITEAVSFMEQYT